MDGQGVLSRQPDLPVRRSTRWRQFSPSKVLTLTPTTTGSFLIDNLPAATRAAWAGRLAEVNVSAGAVLIVSGQPVNHVYFPTTALVAGFNRETVETPMAATVVTKTSLVGLGVLLDGDVARHDVVVLVPGQVLRLEAGLLRDEFERCPAVRRLMLGVLRVYISELSQLATCNRFHTLEQQLCLRLLQIIDQLGGDELAITQAELALLIGARRERVNQIVGNLKADGIVDLGRGRLTRLDRPGLLRQACGCYAVLARAQERLKRLADDARAA
jgi:CRP-like cAMP-binding protein